MYTIQDYIDSLKNDKATLVDNLETKGITDISDDNTFTELVPKVLDIESVNNQNKQVTITSNGTTNVSPDTGYTGLGNVEITTNVGADTYFVTTISSSSQSIAKYLKTIPLINTTGITDLSGMFANCINLITIPLIDTSSVTNMSNMFNACYKLISIPQIDTSNVTNMIAMFGNCTSLETIPLLNTSSVTNFASMFQNTSTHLTDTSLDNILQMCINATSYTGTKTLLTLGINYPPSRIQALLHYQDFIDAGWTLGY